ncbi:MAG: outer membrane lipoprotein-sorting protein [Bacteroidota bacterium]|nr:outer membrane lipoprotein-sorting protein [Bacteroidota bacterium]
MKKLSLSIAIALLVSVSFLSAQTLDKVLANYFEVTGQETMLASKNSKSTGKMIQMGMEIPFVQHAAAPNKFHLAATFQGMTLIQTYNGTEGWSLNPFAGQTEPQPMSEDELKAMKVQADYEGMLWNWKEKGYVATLEENEEVEGADCYVVKLVSENGDTYTNYIDAENYVAIKLHAKVKIQGQEVESETFMSNFQEGDGFIFPGKIETRANGQVVSTIVLETTELNVELDSTFFDKPTK